MTTTNFDEYFKADCSDKYIYNQYGINAMKLFEIVDLSNEQRNVERLKQNAKRNS
jgi:hypothetical protein